VAGFGVISPCLAREAIPQLAGLTELVLGDQGTSSAARVRRVPCRPLFCFVLCTFEATPPFPTTAMMTSESVRIHPLSEQQERRLLDYLDGKYLEIHQGFSRRSALGSWHAVALANNISRHESESKLPTLQAYLLAMRTLLTLTLQIPPVALSGMLRTSLLLRLTGTVLDDIIGYRPDVADLIPLLQWLDILDRGWFSVLCRHAWDPMRGGVELPEELLKKTPLPTQTDCTRVHSLLATGISALENWMEGKDEDEDKEDNLVHDMRRLGCQSTFDELFHRTLTKLHALEQDKVDDEEELLAHLPSWNTAEENPDVDVAGVEGDGVDVDGSNEDTEEILYDHI
jgi:hypothetical protein